MTIKDSLINKLETQAGKWSKQIEALYAESEEKIAKAKDDEAEARIEREFASKIKALEAQIEQSREELKKIVNTGEDKLQDLKDRIDEWLPSNTN
ncbi:hypothetical protein [Marinobacter sp. SS21]|uniref:hypothetical protein n=1 Tax=Marinobacter sp. SS21 TaxID=2979460 RepID=UPI0023301C62|nr:hypothetical protein [Marinobacter sp. SS21]MDC0661628.1 hypothetical protein [Marinobacter sp. SS21]